MRLNLLKLFSYLFRLININRKSILRLTQICLQKCQIVSVTDVIGFPGYITANGRGGPDDPAGFVFKDCHVSGTGPINLGRAYGNHSRVLFSGTYMENIITPQGWMAAWNTGNE